jgi:uncharacterized protein (DUF302 family)
MKYDLTTYIEKKSFDEVIVLVIAELAKEGFGILSNIDMTHIIKSKVNKDIQQYVILGACNPSFSYTLIKDEDLIGLFLPCNVLIQKEKDNKIKLSIIDPETFIDIVNDPRVASVILEVKKRLSNVIKVMDAVE